MNVDLVPFGKIFAPAKRSTVGKKNVPILSITMADGLVDQADRFKKRIASKDISQYKRVQRNQLVVGFPINEGVIAFQRKYDEAGVSPAYAIWDVQSGMSVHHEYVERVLRSPEMRKRYETKMRGTAGRRRNMPKDELEKVPIPLPPLAEQKRIAVILDAVDALRAKRREALVQLDTLLRATFVDLFGDPVTNPKGWEQLRFSDIGEVVTGNTPSRLRPEYYGDAIEWIKSDNINDPSFYLTKAEEGLSSEGMKVARSAPPGSILVTCIAGSPSCIGNAAISDRQVSFNQQINALIPNRKVNVYFAFTLLWIAPILVQKASTNSMKGMVSKSAFSDIQAPIPPIAIQERFAAIFKAAETQKRRYTSHLAELDTLFASLQSRAFRGEL